MSQLMKKSFLLALLCIAVHSNASPLFDDNAVIDVELTGPIESLIRKKDDSAEVPFVLKANGVEQQRYRFAFAARAACASANFHR